MSQAEATIPFRRLPAAPPRRAALGRSAIPVLAGTGIALIVLFLVAILLRTGTLFGDARGLAALAKLFGRADYYLILLDTFYFAGVTTLTAMVFGVPIAWLTERTDLPGRDFIRLMMTAGILLPGFFTAMGWLFLAHPRIGMINGWLRAHFDVTVNVATLSGMGMVQGLALATLTFVVAAPSLAAVDPALEESAEVHGLRLWWRLISITLPLITPALVASALLTFMVALAVFDVPAVLGLSNKLILYSTYIYVLVNPSQGVPLYEVAAASSTPMLLLAAGLSLLYYRFVRRSHRYQVVSGKAYRSNRARLGRRASIIGWAFIALYVTLAIALPLLTIVWTSFLPFFRPVSLEATRFLSFGNYAGLLSASFWDSVRNTIVLSVVAPTVTVLLSLTISWVITRRRSIAGRWFEIIAFLPLSIPSVIFAVGAISIALMLGSALPIYGTIWLIILVEIVIRISIATRVTTSAMLQIHNELDEAGAVFGLSPATRFFRILVPLLMPAVAYCWIFLALLSFRELTVPALLVSRDNVTMSVYTWGLMSSGSFGRASALTILVILPILGIGLAAVVANRVLLRFRPGAVLPGAPR